MLRLLIVEDEKWEREGLIDFLDWKSFGIEIAGTARDGEEGYQEALRLRPDIILTDIKMPGMDGIEMSKKIKEVMPHTKIIILTGYDDFRYAKEAISFSANAYVLKPFEEDELIPIIEEVVSLCRKEREKASWEKRVVSQLNKSRKTAKTNFLFEWASGMIKKEDLQKGLQEFNIYVKAEGMYAVALIKAYGCESKTESSNRLKDISEFLAEKSMLRDYLFLTENQKDHEIILCFEWDGSIIEWLNNGISKNQIEYGNNFVIGVGNGSSPLELHVSYNQAKEAIKHQIFWNDYQLVLYSEIHQLQESFMEKANEFLVHGDYFSKQFIHAVGSINENRVFELLNELFDFVYEARGASMDFIINFVKNIVNDLYIFIYKIHSDFTRNYLYEKMWNGCTVKDLKNKMKIFFESVLSVHKSRLSYDEQTVKKVIAIIEERYMEPLSIKTIANEVFLSPNYLGSIFKNFTGKRFNEYITEYRMEKARELLKSPKNKVATVAARVGFQNPSYFCSVFKNFFGVAPGEYQKNNAV
ncbi:MAG: response regulator [Clostridiaceae bacterium]|nr:response regulator [Clostridiaceae bacterium]